MNSFFRFIKALGIKRGDLILAAALLLMSAALGAVFALNQPEPKYVSIRVEGREITRIPIDMDCRYSIGEGNTIEISGGSVRMIYADCPDKICVKTGSISQSGQSIVCAPHKISVTIIGGNENASYDIRTN